MKYVASILLSGFLFYMFGFAVANVGKVLPPDPTPMSAWFPFKLLIFLLWPAVLGYLIGKNNR